MALITPSLYDRDTLLWVEDTVSKLKSGDFANLDLANLIEEVESLGRSQKKELKSRLLVLLEHLLKRLYVDSPQDYRGWEITIRQQRQQIELEIDDSPSLKTIWDAAFAKAWQLALKSVQQDYPQTDFPDRWQFSADLEAMLNNKFWQDIDEL
jgi:hypothetical protein